jgi:transposase
MYPELVRPKAEAHYIHLHSIRRVAALMKVSKSTVQRWIANDGMLKACKEEPCTRRSKTRDVASLVQDLVERDPFLTCKMVQTKLKESHGVQLSVSSAHRALRVAKITFKVTSRSKRHYAHDVSHQFFQDPLVYEGAISVDESSFSNNEMPLRGWAKKGVRVPRPPPGHRKTISLLLAISSSGVVRSEFRTGAYNGESFANFLRLLPCNRKIILDNCAIHKSRVVRDVAADRNQTLLYTPPYCPWFNPVEHAFSVSKNTYRQLRYRSGKDCFKQAVMASLDEVQPHKCQAFYRDAAEERNIAVAGGRILR